jgi:hypothetical protein
MFSKRRDQFELALSIHTALGVDAANRAISTVDKTTQETNAKMDMMMKMFAQMVSPEQKEMARFVIIFLFCLYLRLMILDWLRTGWTGGSG